MTIRYVGGQTGSRGDSSSALAVSFALTGGLAAAPAVGDLVIVTVVAASAGSNPAMAVTFPPGLGWSSLGQLNQSAVANDVSMNVSWAIIPDVDPAGFTIPGTGSNTIGQAWTCQVFRGVNTTTPFDVTAVSTGGTGTGRPDPASITPSNSGAWVVVCGGGASAAGATYTAPANFTTNFLTAVGDDDVDAMVGAGYWSGWSSGAVDPATFTGGTTNAADSWAAYTLVLRAETARRGALTWATLKLPASSGPTEARDTTTSDVDVIAAAAAVMTEAADTLTAAANAVAGASSNITESADTATSAAGITVTAAGNVTDQADTLTSAADHPRVGRVSWVQLTLPPAASAPPDNLSATANITEAADTVSSSVAVTSPRIGRVTWVQLSIPAAVPGGVYAVADITETRDTLVSTSGTIPVNASANITEFRDTLGSGSTVGTPGVVTGNASITESANTLTSAAHVGAPPRVARVTWAQLEMPSSPVPILHATSNITEKRDLTTIVVDVIATANTAVTEGVDQLNSFAQVNAADANADATITEAADTATSVGVLPIKAVANITENADTLFSFTGIIAANANIFEAGDGCSSAATVLVRANAGINEAPDNTDTSVEPGPPARLVSYHSAGLWSDGADDPDDTTGTFNDSLRDVAVGIPRPTVSSFTTNWADFKNPVTGRWSVAGSYKKEAGSIAGEPDIYIDLSDDGSTVRETIAPNTSATARYARMRLVCPAGLGVVTYETWSVSCGVVPRVEQGIVTVPAGGSATVTLSGRYMALVSLQLTPKSNAQRMAAWEDLVMVPDNTNSFKVYLFDGSTALPIGGDVMWNFSGIAA